MGGMLRQPGEGLASMLVMVLAFSGCTAVRAAAMKDIDSVPASCRESPYGPGDWLRRMKKDGRTRRYVVHVPPGYDKTRPVPVVLFFHGGGGDAINTRKFAGWDSLADREGFIVVYPDGTGVMKQRGHSFNAGSCCGYAKDRNVDDVGFTAALLDEMERLFCVDRSRVYATGFSNGALMSYRLACELSDRIAAIGPVSGTVGVDHCRPARPVSVIHFHGTADPYEPYKGGRGKPFPGKRKANTFRSVDENTGIWRRILGAPPEPVSKSDKGAASGVTWRGRDGSEVTLWTLRGAGHTWPGGGKIAWEWLLGTTNKDVSATQLMWEFFKKHPMGARQAP